MSLQSLSEAPLTSLLLQPRTKLVEASVYHRNTNFFFLSGEKWPFFLFPYPILFMVTWEITVYTRTHKKTTKQHWIGGGEGAYFFLFRKDVRMVQKLENWCYCVKSFVVANSSFFSWGYVVNLVLNWSIYLLVWLHCLIVSLFLKSSLEEGDVL